MASNERDGQASYHHGALRGALVEAGLSMVEEGKTLSLRGVARRAGVSHAAPYHHFADRRELLAAVAEEALATMQRTLGAAGSEHEEDPARALLEVGVAYVRFAYENPSLFRLVFSAELSNRDGLSALQQAYDEAWLDLRRRAARVLAVDPDAEEVRLRSLRAWALVHGLAALVLDEQVPGLSTAEDAERIARRMLRAGPLRPAEE